jgi:hypothetical protein
MGLVVDHLLKGRGVRERDHEPESVKKMLGEVLKDLEDSSKNADGDQNDSGASEEPTQAAS